MSTSGVVGTVQIQSSLVMEIKIGIISPWRQTARYLIILCEGLTIYKKVSSKIYYTNKGNVNVNFGFGRHSSNQIVTAVGTHIADISCRKDNPMAFNTNNIKSFEWNILVDVPREHTVLASEDGVPESIHDRDIFARHVLLNFRAYNTPVKCSLINKQEKVGLAQRYVESQWERDWTFDALEIINHEARCFYLILQSKGAVKDN